LKIHRRVARLGERLPGPRLAGVPTDPEVLLATLLAGTVSLDDYDRTDADQVSALIYAAALLAAATGPARRGVVA
jgi:hypothetical protein